MHAELAGDRAVCGLRAFENVHRGADILVCGCGESLRELQVPTGAITIGVNDVGRLFDPTYLVTVNPRNQFKADRFQYVENSNARYLFTQLELGRVRPPVVRFALGKYGGTAFDGTRLDYTQNSPYVALCLAVHMGATRIGLIGVDFTDHHFFARTGRHPLAAKLPQIDAEFRRLAAAAAERGVQILNLSRASRLTAFPRMSVEQFTQGTRAEAGTGIAIAAGTSAGVQGESLRVVSYSTTPVAGVPVILARCIQARTRHEATCVWATGDYGNGVKFDGGVAWNREPERAAEALRIADLIIVHNGKVLPQHRELVNRKPVITMAHNYAWNVDCTYVQRGFPGVVVGQYQATLPEFSGWHAVPNPMPLWEPEFSPESKAGPVRICYTPSGSHEAFPSGHRLYWHGKGYRTTVQVLDELARRNDVVVETIRGRQVTHAEALAMKRRAHIVIDECVTGSYHRNSLEGLATGCVVVNGVGLVPAIADVFRRCAPDSSEIPFVSSSLSYLKQTLATLLGSSPVSLVQQGTRNRSWMDRNWSFGEQWTRFWEPVVRAALERKAAAVAATPPRAAAPARAVATPLCASVSTSLASQSRRPHMSAVPACAQARAMEVSVVIPHGGEERVPLLTAVIATLRQTPAVGEIIVVDMAPSRSADDPARRWDCKYVFVQHTGLFERARALNIGNANAERDIIFWLDNDLLLPAGFIPKATAELNERRLDYLLPFTTIRYLSEQDSQRVRRGECDPAVCTPVNTLYSGRSPSNSGAVGVVRRAFLQQFGGMIEGFRGWGGEDNAWNHKVSVLGRMGVTRRSDQHVVHLFHTGSGGYRQTNPGATNPHYAQNVALLQRVCAVRERQRFVEQFPRSDSSVASGSSIAIVDSSSRTDSGAMSAADSVPPTVWLYWEGNCPDWIRACRRTILRHAPSVRALDAGTFDRLRVHDRDIALGGLHVAHRADFIRAYLLAHYGGLWIDSDCLVMGSLRPVLEQLSQHELVAHRERSGVVSNGFVGARAGSRVADAFYRHICSVLRSKQRLGWTTLGSDALGVALAETRSPWLELPCQSIQPICWSQPEAFVQRGQPAEHEQHFDSSALCYMLSNTEISRHHYGPQLLNPDTFFSYLLRRALVGTEAPGRADYEGIFSAMGEQYRKYGDESVSGPGSSRAQTQTLRERLPILLAHLGVRNLLDAPCGDFNWMQHVNLGLEQYIGVDVVGELAALNQQLYGEPRRRFLRADIIQDELPAADAVLSRDFLVHLRFEEIFRCLRAFQRTGARYLMVTTFPGRERNDDTSNGVWRTLNLERAPFNFPKPLCLVNENCTEAGGAYADKSLGVFRLQELMM
jgi:hypothetical protein